MDIDRLSSLPDDVIHKILSFISMKDAIRSSVLSSRWRFIWTSMPNLSFSSEDFNDWQCFSKFVSNVVSGRNNQIQVSSVNLVLLAREPHTGSHEFLKRMLDYTFSHNVQQLEVSCDHLEKSTVGFPLSLFSSPSLKHLRLIGSSTKNSPYIATPAWQLPALTTLDLDFLALSDHDDGLFSKCTNLKNLSISKCRMMGTNDWKICHPRLSNLSLRFCASLNVVAPQLKNLTLIECTRELVISAPTLTSLVINGLQPFHLSTQGFPCLEKVELCIYDPQLADAHKIVSLLQQLRNVKLLILNLGILELLSLSMEPCVFGNLKILSFSKDYPFRVYMEVQEQEKVTRSNDPSPRMVSCEEIRAMRNMILVQEAMKNIQNKPHMHMLGCKRKMHEQEGKAGVKKMKQTQMQCHFGVIMAQIKEEQGKIKGSLQSIQKLLTLLPESNRAAMQPTFYSLCQEAANIGGVYQQK